MPKWWSAGRPTNRTSKAVSSSVTRKMTLGKYIWPEDVWRTRQGTIHVLKDVNVAGSDPFVSTTWIRRVLMVVIRPMLFSTADYAIKGDEILPLLPS